MSKLLHFTGMNLWSLVEVNNQYSEQAIWVIGGAHLLEKKPI